MDPWAWEQLQPWLAVRQTLQGIDNVAELALDDDQRHAFVGHLDGRRHSAGWRRYVRLLGGLGPGG